MCLIFKIESILFHINQIERESGKAEEELGHQLEDKINQNPNSQIPAKCSQSDMNETKVMAETVESISTTQVNTIFILVVKGGLNPHTSVFRIQINCSS